jgi:hypothetical protein
MIAGGGNRSNQRKPAQVLFCLPQNPLYLSWERTGAAAVESLSYGTAPEHAEDIERQEPSQKALSSKVR